MKVYCLREVIKTDDIVLDQTTETYGDGFYGTCPVDYAVLSDMAIFGVQRWVDNWQRFWIEELLVSEANQKLSEYAQLDSVSRKNITPADISL